MQLMKSARAGLLLVALLFTLVIGSLSTSAQGNVAAGADMMPADTVLYASIRTDAGYIETLDGVLNNLYAQVSAALPPDMTGMLPPIENPISTALDDSFRGEFATTVRPWLGEQIAIGIGGDLTADMPDISIVVDITDRAAARAFAESDIIASDSITVEELDGYDILTDEMVSAFIAINDDVMVLTTAERMLPPNITDTLAANGDFSKALDALPAESYNIFGYVDGTSLLELANAAVDTDQFVDPATVALLADLQGNLGVIALGATILDGDTLTIDYAQQATGDLLAGASTPVDPAFMSVLPAGTDLLIHASNLNGTFTTALQGLQGLAELGATDGTPVQNVDELLNQIDGLLLMTVGIDFSNDVIGWMTSDFALYADYQPLPIAALTDPNTTELNIASEIGFVVRTTDVDAATAVVEAIATTLADPGVGIPTTREDIGGANALVISLAAPGITAPDLIIAANENVFVIGTRTSAEALLNGTGGFMDSELAQDAANYYLPSATSVWYVDGPEFIGLSGDVTAGLIALGPAIDAIFNQIIGSLDPDAASPGEFPSPEELQAQVQLIQDTANQLRGLLDHATISTSYVDGILRARATITLGG